MFQRHEVTGQTVAPQIGEIDNQTEELHPTGWKFKQKSPWEWLGVEKLQTVTGNMLRAQCEYAGEKSQGTWSVIRHPTLGESISSIARRFSQ